MATVACRQYECGNAAAAGFANNICIIIYSLCTAFSHFDHDSNHRFNQTVCTNDKSTACAPGRPQA